MIKRITNFLIIFFIFQQLKSQISQIDQNGYNPFCDETLHFFRKVTLILGKKFSYHIQNSELPVTVSMSRTQSPHNWYVLKLVKKYINQHTWKGKSLKSGLESAWKVCGFQLLCFVRTLSDIFQISRIGRGGGGGGGTHIVPGGSIKPSGSNTHPTTWTGWCIPAVWHLWCSHCPNNVWQSKLAACFCLLVCIQGRCLNSRHWNYHYYNFTNLLFIVLDMIWYDMIWYDIS